MGRTPPAAGKKLKFVKFEEIKDVNGILVPHKLSARTVRGKKVESTTVLHFTELSYDNADISDDNFSQRQLEKGI